MQTVQTPLVTYVVFNRYSMNMKSRRKYEVSKCIFFRFQYFLQAKLLLERGIMYIKSIHKDSLTRAAWETFYRLEHNFRNDVTFYYFHFMSKEKREEKFCWNFLYYSPTCTIIYQSLCNFFS